MATTDAADSTPLLSFGEWLRRQRGGLGLTQPQLAEKLGCAPITLRKIEAEERKPSDELIARINRVLRVPADQSAALARFAKGDMRAGAALRSTESEALADARWARNVPVPPYPLMGRSRALAEARDYITKRNMRVVTLAGPPGVGKTRLALELAHALHRAFAHGARFVDLATIREASQAPAAIATALQIEDSAGIDTAEAVVLALRDRQMLLLLDNFEHVLDAAAYVAQLIARCPQIVCMVTSREPLRIRAEQVLRVPPLALPATTSMSAVIRAPASSLFLARARQVNADWPVTRADAPPIAALCAELDGLPLALELLAARADLFSPAELHAQLRNGLDALDDGPRDLPARHRTLRNAIGWSVRMLTSAQQALFAHLAVFAGSFDGAAAQAVFAHDPADLEQLARCSLVQPFGANRWRVLETIRQYGEELLSALHTMDDARRRMAAHGASVAIAARDGLLGPQAQEVTAQLDADYANLRAAITWSLKAGLPEYALTIGQGIFRFWFRRGLWREGLAWLEAALIADEQLPSDAARATDAIRANARRAAGVLAQTLSHYDAAERHYQAGLTLAYALEDDAQVASTYTNLGILRKEQGRFEEALAFFDQSIPHQTPNTLKFPWQSKADVLTRLGRFDEAAALYRRAMALNRRIADEEGLAHTLRGLSDIACRGGDTAAAEQLLSENEAICRRLNHTRALSWTAHLFGNIARARGEWAGAAARYADALEQMREMGDAIGICELLCDCALLADAASRLVDAAHSLACACSGFRALGAALTPYEESQLGACAARCRAALGDMRHAAAAAVGAEYWPDDAVPQALAWLRALMTAESAA